MAQSLYKLRNRQFDCDLVGQPRFGTDNFPSVLLEFKAQLRYVLPITLNSLFQDSTCRKSRDDAKLNGRGSELSSRNFHKYDPLIVLL